MTKQHIETHHSGGWPKIYPYDSLYRRLREAWWVLAGRYSLHSAWQKGYDDHIRNESARLARVSSPPRAST